MQHGNHRLEVIPMEANTNVYSEEHSIEIKNEIFFLKSDWNIAVFNTHLAKNCVCHEEIF